MSKKYTLRNNDEIAGIIVGAVMWSIYTAIFLAVAAIIVWAVI